MGDSGAGDLARKRDSMAAPRAAVPSSLALYAAAIALSVVLSACRPAGPAAVPPPPAGRERLTAEPRVRVGVVVDSARVTLSASAPFELAGPDGAVLARAGAGASWVVAADSAGRLTGMEQGGSGRLGPVAGPLALRVPEGSVLVNGRPYRGGVLVVTRAPGLVTAINVLDLEAYLRGVVPYEIGHRPPAEVEAVKAQAVAARTYAVGGLGKSRAFDFYATVMDQVYGGVAGEDSVGNRAVAETRGQIVTYQGQPIQAYYYSTCGGRTASIKESWPWRAPQPYLQSVSDRIPGTDRYYCDISSRFRWRTSWTAGQLRSVLSATLALVGGRPRTDLHEVQAVRVLARNPSGRVDSLLIRVDGRSYFARADSVRWLLRTPAGALLNSSMLQDVALHPEGDSIALEIRGGGWGHGIGMCQWGAIGRARAGQRYADILRTYYQGTQVTRLY